MAHISKRPRAGIALPSLLGGRLHRWKQSSLLGPSRPKGADGGAAWVAVKELNLRYYIILL